MSNIDKAAEFLGILLKPIEAKQEEQKELSKPIDFKKLTEDRINYKVRTFVNAGKRVNGVVKKMGFREATKRSMLSELSEIREETANTAQVIFQNLQRAMDTVIRTDTENKSIMLLLTSLLFKIRITEDALKLVLTYISSNNAVVIKSEISDLVNAMQGQVLGSTNLNMLANAVPALLTIEDELIDKEMIKVINTAFPASSLVHAALTIAKSKEATESKDKIEELVSNVIETAKEQNEIVESDDNEAS